MYDKREAILLKMLAILHTIDGPPELGRPPDVFRNRGEIPVDKLPALVLLDGREEIGISTHNKGGILATTIYTLHPQVFVMLKPTENVNNDGIGETLSGYRVRLLKAFTTDEELFGMLGSNGEVMYLGHETDMQTGSTMLGQMQMRFSLSYVLNPKDML